MTLREMRGLSESADSILATAAAAIRHAQELLSRLQEQLPELFDTDGLRPPDVESSGRWAAKLLEPGHYRLCSDGLDVGDLYLLPEVGHVAVRADYVRAALDSVDRLVAL